MAMTGQQVADKWARRLKGASQDMRDGVNAVTQAPGIAASKKSAKMLEGITRSIQDGTWQRAVASVSLDDWKKAMLDKGVGRIAAGVDGAMPKMTIMADKLMNALGTIKSKVSAMPDNTFEDRLARMNAQITEMHKVRLR
jgi:hypothetical protein